jgi:hypothetical protein
MKKIALVVSSIVLMGFNVAAQDSTQPKEKEFPSMMESMKEMQEQMMKLFGGGSRDTLSKGFSYGFGGDGSDFMKIDTSMSKSFGFMFDGKNFKSLTPNQDENGGGMNDIIKQLEERMQKMMPDTGKNFDMMDMFKGFGNMFGEDTDAMPKVVPKDKKRLGEDETKEKKYKTEKL